MVAATADVALEVEAAAELAAELDTVLDDEPARY